MTAEWWERPVADAPEVPVLSLPEVEEIADRAPSDDHALDWDRIRAAIRAVRPVRCLTVIGLGFGPAWLWADRVAGPVSAAVSADTAFAAAVAACGIAAVGAATGGRVRRWVCAALLVAAVGGSLIADPTRHLVAAWIVGA
ncbi:hypothetical protein ACWD7Y_32760 [Streptomyces drozdowiczii]